MKYLIKTNIDRVRVTTLSGKNKLYSSKYFKRDKADLEFMTDFDLKKWYLEEYLGEYLYDEDASAKVIAKAINEYVEDNKELNNREFLELKYLEGGDSILTGAWKISKDYFDTLATIYANDERVTVSKSESNKEEYVVNGDLEFLYGLDKSGLNYEIIN